MATRFTDYAEILHNYMLINVYMYLPTSVPPKHEQIGKFGFNLIYVQYWYWYLYLFVEYLIQDWPITGEKLPGEYSISQIVRPVNSHAPIYTCDFVQVFFFPCCFAATVCKT